MAKPPYIVEDSGLFIRALNWFPGTLSSQVFRKIGNRGILKLMEGVEDRYAVFRSAIALGLGENVIKVFEGVAEGEVALEARGSGGFGYDPIFIPSGHRKTFAEMDVDEKNKVSHRGMAVRRLIEYLKTTNIFK
jgi:XTP/dITP diphosphohydrolase